MKNIMLDNIKINIPRFTLKGFDLRRRYIYLTVYHPPQKNRKFYKEVEDLIARYYKIAKKPRFFISK
jgi:hypothetical protein